MAEKDSDLSKSARERLERIRIIELYATIRTGLRLAAAVLVAYLFVKAIEALSGEDTSVVLTATLSILADVKFVLAISLTGLAAAWAVIERKLRHRKVESMQARITELEKRLDPNRSTSGLTTAGKTNPKDKAR